MYAIKMVWFLSPLSIELDLKLTDIAIGLGGMLGTVCTT